MKRNSSQMESSDDGSDRIVEESSTLNSGKSGSSLKIDICDEDEPREAGSDDVKIEECQCDDDNEPDCDKTNCQEDCACDKKAGESQTQKASGPTQCGKCGERPPGGTSVSQGSHDPGRSCQGHKNCLAVPKIQRLKYADSIGSTCSSCHSNVPSPAHSIASVECDWDRER